METIDLPKITPTDHVDSCRPIDAEIASAATVPHPEATGSVPENDIPLENDNAPETAPETAGPSSVMSMADIEALIAEAEQRGYLRGRNENIESLMQAPGIYERPRDKPAAHADQTSEVLILNNIRRSVWA